MIRVALEVDELNATISALSAYRNEISVAMRQPSRSEAQRAADMRSYELVASALAACQLAAFEAETAREKQLHLRDAKRLGRV